MAYISQLRRRGKFATRSFTEYVGLKPFTHQLDATFWIIVALTLCLASVTAVIQNNMSEASRSLLWNESSPYAKILKNGSNIEALLSGLAYCFIQAGGSEEIFFRGLIGRRLNSVMVFWKANLIQALVFWLFHLVLVYLVTGQWFSGLQLFAFAMSCGLGLLFGFVNHRKNGNSIGPSWLLHSLANFTTLLTLAVLK
jgi:membrane protease YdiL (CAAX protease family)